VIALDREPVAASEAAPQDDADVMQPADIAHRPTRRRADQEHVPTFEASVDMERVSVLIAVLRDQRAAVRM